jgi:hypothetical protein
VPGEIDLTRPVVANGNVELTTERREEILAIELLRMTALEGNIHGTGL